MTRYSEMIDVCGCFCVALGVIVMANNPLELMKHANRSHHQKAATKTQHGPLRPLGSDLKSQLSLMLLSTTAFLPVFSHR